MRLPWSDSEHGEIQILNEATPIGEFVECLVKHNYQHKIIMESTGHYHWLIAVELAKHSLDLRLINPLLSSKHAKASIRKTKTDKVDAYRLATMALTERDLPAIWRRDERWVEIRHKIGLLKQMELAIQRLKSTLADHEEALTKMGVMDDEWLLAFQRQVDALAKLKKTSEKTLTDYMKQSLRSERQKRFESIPGVSAYLAGILDLFMENGVPSIKSWIAFAGLDIGIKQSGNWQGRSRLSKRGNAYLRKRLYQAAWGAKQNNEQFKAYYEALREQGRPYVECLLILARKILRIAYRLSQNGDEYNGKMWASS
jgi:transposase